MSTPPLPRWPKAGWHADGDAFQHDRDETRRAYPWARGWRWRARVGGRWWIGDEANHAWAMEAADMFVVDGDPDYSLNARPLATAEEVRQLLDAARRLPD